MTSTPLLTAVVGASGGLGASTLALAVGRRLAATGPPAVVVDLDLLRGGLEVTAGIEHLPGRRWDDLRHVQGRVEPGALVSVLPGEEGCAVLSARGGAPPGVPESAARDVVTSLAQGSARVVLDLPLSSPVLPGVLSPGALVVLVVGLRTRALADADAAVARLLDAPGAPDVVPDLRLVTRGGRAGADVVDEVVAHLGVAHLHHLPDDPHVPRDAERGLFPGTGRDAVRRCADAVVAAVDAVAEAS
jgi:MinD-like ATPase involved in chromosome partitioning or flagellar assembly